MNHPESLLIMHMHAYMQMTASTLCQDQLDQLQLQDMIKLKYHRIYMEIRELSRSANCKDRPIASRCLIE